MREQSKHRNESIWGERFSLAKTTLPGEVIFEIPFRYCFQDDYENESSLSWSARMGMKLLEERAKGEKSERYEKWIESLPVEAPFLPGIARDRGGDSRDDSIPSVRDERFEG